MKWTTTQPTVTGQYVVNVTQTETKKTQNCVFEVYQENDQLQTRPTNLESWLSNPLAEFNVYFPAPEFTVMFLGPLDPLDSLVGTTI